MAVSRVPATAWSMLKVLVGVALPGQHRYF
jgi:hypothetical protein